MITAVASLVAWDTEPAASRDTDGSTLDGAALFRAKGCATCHAGPGTAVFNSFPPLTNAAAWAGDRRPGMSAADYLAESMRSPSAFISPVFVDQGGPSTAMPDLGLTEEEVDALVSFLLGRRRG